MVLVTMRSRKVLRLELLLGLLSLGIMTCRTLAFVFPSRGGSRAKIGMERVTSRSCSFSRRHYSSSTSTALPASVTGTVYTVQDEGAPRVSLFTKEGCTLCDKVKDILISVRDDNDCPHSLEAVDITDADKTDIYDKYKYDIPILHISGQYWTKHRITAEEAVQGITEAKEGRFNSPSGEPDAGALERKQAERLKKD
jgi:thiol-disulfide isomerase/thioredoxin